MTCLIQREALLLPLRIYDCFAPDITSQKGERSNNIDYAVELFLRSGISTEEAGMKASATLKNE